MSTISTPAPRIRSQSTSLIGEVRASASLIVRYRLAGIVAG